MTDDKLDAHNEVKSRFFGKSATRTVIQLIIASIIVGAIFSFLGLGPQEFWRGIFDGVKDLLSAIGESFGEIALNLATYLVIGAAVVVPIWLVARLLSSRK